MVEPRLHGNILRTSGQSDLLPRYVLIDASSVRLLTVEDHDELLYSLRSVEQYAPWFRRIYIVTDGQVPVWLNLSHPKIRLVTHSEIFENVADLPTFKFETP